MRFRVAAFLVKLQARAEPKKKRQSQSAGTG
jgi:hypothetical protein